MLFSVQCQIYRGGTSKGVFFNEKVLPQHGYERDSVLLSIMGSPDISQIDGLGGGVSTTSKIAIISKSDNSNYDVNYTFAQVSVDKALVSYKGNCGNISSAVGPYAIENGLVEINDPITVVRIYNTNTDKIIHAYINTPNKKITYEGDCRIPGVPGTASEIKLVFMNPEGAVTGKLLPTGNAIDTLDIPGFKKIEASLVDATNPLVIIRAEDVGMTGKELPENIDSDTHLLELLERIRGEAAVKLGFCRNYRDSAVITPSVPKMAIVSTKQSYTTVQGEIVDKESIDILGRMMSMQRTHKTYALTGALCTVAAAAVHNSIVNRLVCNFNKDGRIRIGQPTGVLEVGVEVVETETPILKLSSVYGIRTARKIMTGTVIYKRYD